MGLQEQFDEVDAAIKTMIATGQGVTSYTVTLPGGGSRMVQRSLDQMRQWRDQLRHELQDEKRNAASGGAVNFARRGSL